MIRSLTAVLALMLATPFGASAQEPEVVDRVVAVVGDSAILASDVDEQIEQRRAFGQPIPTEPAALDRLRRQELELLVNEMVLLQAAARDSVIVPDSDIEGQVEATIAEQERRFGSRAALEQALRAEGTTMSAYRNTIAQSVRRAGIRQQFLATIQRDRPAPPVRESEVREFFEARRGELGPRPATIEFEQIVVKAAATDSAMAAARAEAEQALAELADGADFATVARRYSDDAGTRERGGELGWFRRGRMVPAFEQVAFSLRPGQVSGIVETAFGLHIIKVDRMRGPERLARHILIRPEITAADEARTEERATAVANALRAGAPFDSLAAIYHDPAEQDRVGPALQDSLPAPYSSELRGRTANEIVGPFAVPATSNAFAVVRVRESAEAGEYTFEDEEIRAQIRSFLQRERMMEEVLGELRERTYIDIRY